jgi:hypothetical protein
VLCDTLIEGYAFLWNRTVLLVRTTRFVCFESLALEMMIELVSCGDMCKTQLVLLFRLVVGKKERLDPHSAPL